MVAGRTEQRQDVGRARGEVGGYLHVDGRRVGRIERDVEFKRLDCASRERARGRSVIAEVASVAQEASSQRFSDEDPSVV